MNRRHVDRFQEGIVPLWSDKLNIYVNGLASSSATDFKRREEMPSGPVAFLTPNFRNRANTSQTAISQN